MSLIQQKIAAWALANLANHGFERDPQRPVCNDFTKRLAASLERLCAPLAEHYAMQMQQVTGQKRLDVFSKAITDLSELCDMTIRLFKNHILLQEMINPGAGSISCETAAMHLNWLQNPWREAEIRMDANKQVKPSSPKAQKKRAEAARKYDWLPWPFRIRT